MKMGFRWHKTSPDRLPPWRFWRLCWIDWTLWILLFLFGPLWRHVGIY